MALRIVSGAFHTRPLSQPQPSIAARLPGLGSHARAAQLLATRRHGGMHGGSSRSSDEVTDRPAHAIIGRIASRARHPLIAIRRHYRCSAMHHLPLPRSWSGAGKTTNWPPGSDTHLSLNSHHATPLNTGPVRRCNVQRQGLKTWRDDSAPSPSPNGRMAQCHAGCKIAVGLQIQDAAWMHVDTGPAAGVGMRMTVAGAASVELDLEIMLRSQC
jgi:hypothetical protein